MGSSKTPRRRPEPRHGYAKANASITISFIVCTGFVTVLAVLLPRAEPLSASFATPQHERHERARARSAIAAPTSDPATHYIPASSVERPPVVQRARLQMIEPADPARNRPAMHSVNGVDGDRPPRPVPGLR
jgi:hypothetical protein